MEKKKKTKQSSMASMANSLKAKRRRLSHSKCSKSSLPNDLLIPILSRLPVKSALRFRCVSKEWLALLSDRGPYSIRYLRPTMYGFFYRRRLVRSLQYAPIHPYRDQHLDIKRLTSHLPDHDNLFLLDSCNGLLLFLCVVGDNSFKSMIVCNPFGDEKTNWVIIHLNVALTHLPVGRRFISARLDFHRHDSPQFKCLLFFEDQQANQQSLPWFTILSTNTDQQQNVYVLPQRGLPPLDFYDGTADDDYPKLCIIHDDDTDYAICPSPATSLEGGVRSLMGLSGGVPHYALCNPYDLQIWVLASENGHRTWNLKHTHSNQPLINLHNESYRRHRHDDDRSAYSIAPLGFHPDLDVIFMQIEWRIYALHLTSGSLEEVAGERGANPYGERFLFYPFTMDPSVSLGDKREYHMEIPDMNQA
ncbi:F-box protein At5g07610-like [Musa acuminata AAA Group]|uniref:F-box protein At5g07610-like n=1 Tax=Musa acuminata AAA Group TaxID=214697 RepID=UPI0031E43C23